MPDPFRHVVPGEEVVVPAEAYNAMLDAGQAERRRQLDRTSRTPDIFRQGTIVRVKNQSGRALSRRHILGLSAPIFTPTQSLDAFQREVTFRGTIPDSSHRGKFAVLLDPIDVGRIGRAHVDGVTQVKVNVLDPGHTCCDVAPGDTHKLVSMANGGSAQMLWTETGQAGEQWAIVRLGTNCRVCCTSSSSSSSSDTSHECPTGECGACGEGKVSCDMVVEVTGLNSGDFNCAQLNGAFHCIHVSGCTWFASFGENPTPTSTTCTLSFDGVDWTVEVVSPLGKSATFIGPGFDCRFASIFGIDSTNCDVFLGAQAHVTPT